jgi:hypothetical protein
MDKERLTLENVKELGLDLLKKENWDSIKIEFNWNYDDEFSKEQIDEIKDLKEKNKYETFEDAVSDYLANMNSTTINEMQMNVVEEVLKKYVDYDKYSDEYERLSEQLLEMVEENFEIDINEMEVLGNTRIEEINVFLCESNKNSLYGESFSVENYKKPILLKEELEKEFNPIVFLIQSQGYEVEDLFNKEKVENSKFLKSLKEEFENVSGTDYANLVFSKISANYTDLMELENSEDNIKIPKEMSIIGLIDTNGGAGSSLSIELEKDIVINRDNAKIVSDFNDEGEGYSVQRIFGLTDTPHNINFKTTKEKGFETHDFEVENVYEKAIISLNEEEKEMYIEAMPIFEEFIDNKIVADIKNKYLFGSEQQDLFFNSKTPDKLAESLINEREKRNGAMINPELDEVIFEKYTEEEDFYFEANSLKECMQSYYKTTISNAIDRAEEKIRKSTPLLAEYEIDKNNLTTGDIKSICNIISGGDIGKVFSDIEIFKDIRAEKELAPEYDNETFDKKVTENLKGIYSDWRNSNEYAIKNLRDDIHIDCKDEEARERFSQYVSSFGREKIDDEMFFEELSFYKDFEIDESIMETLQENYNKEHNITDFGKYIEELKEEFKVVKEKEDFEEKIFNINEKNKLLSEEKLDILNKEIKEMQGDILTHLEESNYFEKQGNNYKIQEALLEKDNFRNIVKDFIPNNFEFENDMFLKNLTRKELVERYNIATPDFEIYSKNGDELFYSNVDDYSDIEDIRENLEKFIVETKGQEFWDNMNIFNINDWDDLLKSGEVVGVSINDGVENQFTSTDEYLSFIFEDNNIYDYVYDEIKVYGEELRQELEKNSKDNIISVEKFDKLKEKYSVNGFKDNNREEIEEKEIEDEKEMDI